MTIKSIWLRRIHKWVGLVIGLQFLIWAISGAAMALISMDEVAGGAMSETVNPAAPPTASGWANVQRQLADQPIAGARLRSLPGRQAVEVSTDRGTRLFDAGNGEPIRIDRSSAATIAKAAHPDGLSPSRVTALTELTLAVREHELPIWRVDFADEKGSSYYVSGATGDLLERRNDSWRWWDFFWMLHNMDYANRTSFNHPLIITVGIAMAWLAVTGFWLLFRTMWRHDFAAARRFRARYLQASARDARNN
ncbi:MAG TPA: PepSY domain-containing protein [Sphingomicrobium sp.]|nr:PepSY domain-containing protein [Sphingomicrobium sp.]